MRLFISINFSEDIKDKLNEITMKLKKVALKGSPTLRDNHHLTLAFIGENTELTSIRHCIDRVNSSSFLLTTGRLDRFHRNGDDIIWLAIEYESHLFFLQKQLTICLRGAGFKLDNRPFRPHLTLMRRAIMPTSFSYNSFNKTILQINQNIDSISLMESNRSNGNLVYSEIYTKKLKKV